MEYEASLDYLIDEDTAGEEDIPLTPLEDEELAYWQEIIFNEVINEELKAS